jgi:Flp pilus assembly protein TadG
MHNSISAKAKRTIRRAGSASVETAILLPLILLLALGSTDLGRFSYAWVSVATAARNGAQYGSTSPSCASNAAGIRSAVLREMATVPGSSASNPTVTSTVDTIGPGHTFVRVTVTFRFDSIIPYPGLPDFLNVTRTVYMRVLPT